ncbi:protein kinase [Lentzea sp. NPDC051213]|uniref:protein kinase domain-containing protein n=1 Tax=Lentzea sp. NPDC051213 TaxID=3364126 RepID=UPI00378F0A69
MSAGWEPGDVVLGLYEVRDVVHSGGMGVVHRVRHLGWQVDLAVKTPRPEQVRTPAGRARFEGEAGAWVGLGLHPHTVSCAYVRTIDGVPRVFAEWVDGGSLREAVRGGQLNTVERVLDVAVQTAWGLAHAHAIGLVHQDVKPANVMLEPDGTAKVTDFGLAKAFADEQRPPDVPPTVTAAGMTEAYCSPEQFAGGMRLTTATDVWSWAVTVLEMFAGRRLSRFGPAAGRAMEEFLANGGDIPPAVVDLLRDCFAEDPADRPGDLGVVAELLREIHRELLGADHSRPVPKAARLLSDGLSNHALSLLDLGRAEEADRLWQQAVGADPHHLPSVYNQALHRWRSGSDTGEKVVAELEAVRAAEPTAPAGWGALQLGAVHLERHDDEQAAGLLREAVAAEPESADVAAALAELATRPPQLRADIDTRVRELLTVAVSRSGQVVLTGDGKGRLLLWSPGETRKPLRTLTRRGDTIKRMAMNDAGTRAVVARSSGLELWDLERRKRRKTLSLNDSQLSAVAISRDGEDVVTGHANGYVRMWTDELTREFFSWAAHLGPVTSVAISQDRQQVVSASVGYSEQAGSVRTWSVRGGVSRELEAPVASGRGSVPQVVNLRDAGAVSSDGRYAVAVWSQGPLVLWDAQRGVVQTEVPRHHLAWSRKLVVAGTTFITVGEADDPVQVWDARTGQCLRTLEHGSYRMSVAASSDGRVVVFARRDGTLSLRSLPVPGYRAPWCYVKPRAAQELERAEDAFGRLAEKCRGHVERQEFAAAGEVLREIRTLPGYSRSPELRRAWAEIGVHGRRAGFIGVWPLYHVEGHGEFTQPASAAVRWDGVYAATGRWTGHVDIWDIESAERTYTFDRGESGMAHRVEFTPDGLRVVVLTNAGTIRRLSLVDGSKKLFTDDFGKITAYALSGDRIMIGDETGTLRLREMPSGGLLATIPAHDVQVRAIALSPDGRYAASVACGGTYEGEVQLREVASEQPKWTLSPRDGGELPFFGSDGRVLILATSLRTTVWDVESGEFLYAVDCAGMAFSGRSPIGLSEGGRLAMTPERDGMVVWEPLTGQRVQTLAMGSEPSALALSADGTFAVGAGMDRVIRVFDVRTGQCLRTLPGHGERIDQAVLSRSGNILVTTDLGSGKHVWELAWDFDFPPAG